MAKKAKKRNAYVVGASEYGGPGDPSSGHTGSSGVDLTGKDAFAELDMGHALGDLPYHTKLIITYRQSGETIPKSVTCEKLDIGAGGGPISGHARRVDLWYEVAKQLGFKGTGLIMIERADGKPIAGPNDTNVAKYGLGNTTTGAGILGTGVGPQTEVEGHEASEEAAKAVEGVGGFLGELSLEKITKLVVAVGLGAFALKMLTNAKPSIPI
jgi:hypothetical protein